MSQRPLLFGAKNRLAVEQSDQLGWDPATSVLQVEGRVATTALQGSPVTLTAADTVVLDFDAGSWQHLVLDRDTTFTTDHRRVGATMDVRLDAGTVSRTLTLPNWTWVTAVPASLGANLTATLRLVCWGTGDSNITALWLAPDVAGGEGGIPSNRWRWRNGELQYRFEDDDLWHSLVPQLRDNVRTLAFAEEGEA